MSLIVFVLILFGLQGLCLIAGAKSSKGLKTQQDYFLAGKSVPFFPLMTTFLATQVGGGLILGSAEEAYQFGWTVLFYPLGAALGLVLLGIGVGKKLAQFQVSTIAQIFEVVYRSATLKKIASVLSIVSLFMILIAQIIASHKFMVSLGIVNNLWFIGFWGIAILYTAMGGLKAVVATDVIQAGFFVVVFLLTFGYVFYSADMPIAQLVNTGFNHDHFAFSFSKLNGWLFMPLLFMVIEQDMGQRCFAGASPKAVSRATLWAGALAFLISMVPVCFGILAKSTGIEISEGASVLMLAIKHMTNPLLMALVSVAILCAIISTADSLINAIGSDLSQDFKFLERDNIRLLQVLSASIALAALLCSFYFTNVVDLLIQSYELSVSCLLIPIVMAFFKKNSNALSATFAMLFGACAFVLFRVIHVPLPKELLSVLLSLGGYYLGEAIQSWRMKRAVVERDYR